MAKSPYLLNYLFLQDGLGLERKKVVLPSFVGSFGCTTTNLFGFDFLDMVLKLTS